MRKLIETCVRIHGFKSQDIIEDLTDYLEDKLIDEGFIPTDNQSEESTQKTTLFSDEEDEIIEKQW